MSALWTPVLAGVSPGFLRHGPAPPSQVRPHRPLPAVCAGARWSWLDAGSALSLTSGRPAPRGSGSTGQGLCVLHEGPTYPKCPPPSSSSTPPSCSASRRRRQPPQRPRQPLRQVETAALPSGRHTLNRCLRCHDIRNSQKPRDNTVGPISTVSACRRTSVAGSGCASRSPRWRRPRPPAPRTRA